MKHPTIKSFVSQKFGELVFYNGFMVYPLREALSAFVDKTQETVTGDVKLKLYKGNIINAGITSPYTLYDENIASFGEDGGAYDQGWIQPALSTSSVFQSRLKHFLMPREEITDTLIYGRTLFALAFI